MLGCLPVELLKEVQNICTKLDEGMGHWPSEEPIKIWGGSGKMSGSRNFLSVSLTLRDMAFFRLGGGV